MILRLKDECKRVYTFFDCKEMMKLLPGVKLGD
jgi:hypothetical protein